ncbi:MAG: DUF3530 family protein [Candidatus Thioglobus sp.]|uniref:DUF3530 family protein n=1 Tax=Candidatus Thioglobus sp. TaxID=2026721 RepID=UPI00261DB8BB|nr:DUF3530 family protein [Candidatus Thioglobus sp.]MDC9727118.1 DUF3530 family protein [Candidatus Thioglobus sp.]
MKILSLILLLFADLSFAQTQPDYAKEARWAEQVEDGIMDGDVVWLSANSHDFMAIYTPSESDTKQTAVIVHGLGVHPDWPQVVQPLRVALTERGFNTLSIQMPVLDNDHDSLAYMALLNYSDARIASALEYLQTENLNANVLIAHSLGSVMSTHFLANNANSVERFIGIGMPDKTVNFLKKINLPVLDLYGEKDIQSVMHSALDRSNTTNKQYTQRMVNADHFFNEKDVLLVDEVSHWLK